jgi:hypothetical protein
MISPSDRAGALPDPPSLSAPAGRAPHSMELRFGAARLSEVAPDGGIRGCPARVEGIKSQPLR